MKLDWAGFDPDLSAARAKHQLTHFISGDLQNVIGSCRGVSTAAAGLIIKSCFNTKKKAPINQKYLDKIGLISFCSAS